MMISINEKPQNPESPYETESLSLNLALSPSGHLYFYEEKDNDRGIAPDLFDKIQKLFKGNLSRENLDKEKMAQGLLQLGIIPFNNRLPPSFAFWQTFSQLLIAEACKISGQNDHKNHEFFLIPPPLNYLKELRMQSPFMRGSEYLTLEVMADLWQELCQALNRELVLFKGNFQDYLTAHNPAWHKVGRVCFHLAENKSDPRNPFAFLATYTTRLSTENLPTRPLPSSTASSVQHLPLGNALREYAQQRSHLLSLLTPVHKAAENSPFIKNLVDTGALFKPLAWGSKEAYEFLRSIPLIEAAGVMVRVPNWWTPKNPPRPQVTVAIGNASTQIVGLSSLLDFNMSFSLPNGEELSEREFQEIIHSQEGLVQIKGQWVEVDQEKMTHILSHWKKVERQVKKEGLSFSEGLRLLAGAPGKKEEDVNLGEAKEWSTIVEGPWLQEILSHLRHPTQQKDKTLQDTLADRLQAQLRPYQYQGVHWLWWLYNLRLGGCLADDMGLGKTIQVLSLLLLAKHHLPPQQKPLHLLILPASLLGNWQTEINRFAPTLKVFVAHGYSTNSEKLKDAPDFSDVDLVITTYGNVYRLPWIEQVPFSSIILDEGQNIKNPTTKQTLTIKKLSSQVRFALTGTPIENRLLDLWSLFDFVAPGLLGSSKMFSKYGKKALQQEGVAEGEGERRFYAAIRQLVSPYILRRLKSDKSIISDLPDKTEMNVYCFLSKQQILLYQKSVEELSHQLNEGTEGDPMKRRNLVLSYITRFKQICNHPSQWLGHGSYDDLSSGKFLRLKELCETIAAKQEKVLIFTQFREIIPYLHESLKTIFGCSGLILHGETAIKDRNKLVEAFQEDQGPPFFILSLKAGGTGLTLTKASHVIHFDRWWNPAVENQATDRAYRIGQKKNVLVHKFICQGTIEEKIDFLINSKKTIANDILSEEAAVSLTELSTDDLISIISLDIHRALGNDSI